MRLAIPVIFAVVMLATVTLVVNYSWPMYPYVGMGNMTIDGTVTWHTGSSSLQITLYNATAKYAKMPFPYALINPTGGSLSYDYGTLDVSVIGDNAYVVWIDKSGTPLGYLKYTNQSGVFIWSDAPQGPIEYKNYLVYPITYKLMDYGVDVVINGIVYMKSPWTVYKNDTMYYGFPPRQMGDMLVLWHTIFVFDGTNAEIKAYHKG